MKRYTLKWIIVGEVRSLAAKDHQNLIFSKFREMIFMYYVLGTFSKVQNSCRVQNQSRMFKIYSLRN
jgi:hypothetical protein